MESIDEFSSPVWINGCPHEVSCKAVWNPCQDWWCRLPSFSEVRSLRSKYYQRIATMWDKTKLPLYLWLGRGRPLNPYLRGVIIAHLRVKMQPNELRLPPDNLFEMPGKKDFLEWSILRVWVRQWLRYIHWYWRVAMQEEIKIQNFF